MKISNKMKIKNPKASVLVVSLIIMGLILVTALTFSLTAIRQRNISMGSNKSGAAYQNAETGIEKMMNIIVKNPASTINGLAALSGLTCDAASGMFLDPSSPSTYKILLKDKDGNSLVCSDVTNTAVKALTVKSVGNDAGNQEQRGIEAAVAMATQATQVFNWKQGPLPVSGTFTSNGGTLVIIASGSAYASAPVSWIGMNIDIDGVTRGYSSMVANEAGTHKALVSNSLVVTGIAAGTHTLQLSKCVNAGFNTVTDAADIFFATVLELH